MNAPRRKLAITGGPSGGKTTLIDTLQRDLGHQIAVAPEAASILYRGGFPRRKGTLRQKHVQRAIYFTQFELEALVQDEYSDKLIICDRGSLDSMAYWPSDGTNFLDSINSTLEKEITRYDWVLHLDTAPEEHYDSENPIRTESYSEAPRLNDRILAAWQLHPQRWVIHHHSDFFSKMSQCMKIIKMLLQNKSYAEIQNTVQNFSGT
jgi:nicotinamide riboside kinase